MYVCDHRHHHIFCLDGPTHLVCKLNHCPDPRCSGHRRTVSPEAEATITMPYWVLGWDVFRWIGHRRFARHWSVPQIRDELLDTYKIPLSDEAFGPQATAESVWSSLLMHSGEGTSSPDSP